MDLIWLHIKYRIKAFAWGFTHPFASKQEHLNRAHAAWIEERKQLLAVMEKFR